MHKARSIGTWMNEFGVEELVQHQCRPHCLLEQWSYIPINTLLELVDRLPRGVKAVTATKGGPTPY